MRGSWKREQAVSAERRGEEGMGDESGLGEAAEHQVAWHTQQS